MRRKIIKNRHQYKVNLPIELLRRLQWDDSTNIVFQEVETSKGKGLIILRDKEEVMRVDIR